VVEILKLAKKGHTPSQIGVSLRDHHGIPSVGSITSNKILRILRTKGTGSIEDLHILIFPLGVAPLLPEDLYHLIKKAVNVRKHLERNNKDKDSKVCEIYISQTSNPSKSPPICEM